MHLIRRGTTDDRGFTLITVMLAMMVMSLFAVGAYAASIGDTPIARKDQDRKAAYEAAQAGIDWYANQLRANPDYWKKCADAAASPAVPLTIEGEGVAPNRWETVALTSGEGKFRVELMKLANGTKCLTSNPYKTARDAAGLVWIRSTGVANGKVRSVLAAFQQQSDFLKYLYFSNWEAQDPQLGNVWQQYPDNSNRNACDYVRKTRDRSPWPFALGADVLGVKQLTCVSAQYRGGDELLGPFHTNDDSIYGCGGTIGRPGDTFEVAAINDKWNARTVDNAGYNIQEGLAYAAGCGGETQIKSTPDYQAPALQLPPSNVRLKTLAEGAADDVNYIVRSGQTCLVLDGNKVTIYNKTQHTRWGSSEPRRVMCDGTPETAITFPKGGVIYIKNDPTAPCTPRYGHNASTSYTSSVTCGDVAVSGTYDADLTIAAENDIVINGDVTRAGGSALLGLVANGFVRIHHPLRGDPYEYENQESQIVTDEKTTTTDGSCTGGGAGGGATYPNCLVECNNWTANGNKAWVNRTLCVGHAVVNTGPPFYWNIQQLDRWITLNNPLDATAGYLGTVKPTSTTTPTTTWVCQRTPPIDDPAIYKPVTKIQAAVLSMQHTFQLDNMQCERVSELEFLGSISVYWGAHSVGSNVGFANRKWTYDENFRTAQPPNFIAPLNSDGRWSIQRRTEQAGTPVGKD